MAVPFVPLQDGTTYHDGQVPPRKVTGDDVQVAVRDPPSALPKAFVTLLTSPSYLPGALVLLHSLQDVHPEPRDFSIVCLVTPETVDARTIRILRDAGYDMVIGVEPISSGESGQSGLALMGRPDLDLALTKLHIFRLGHIFSSIIFLDADTLPLSPLSHLFDVTQEHTLSACPDQGWPDCFNSGVLVVRPQLSDFENLWQLLRNHSDSSEDGNGSFDGADQGLLNFYFSGEGKGETWNRLPFIYNVTPSAAYQYAPAFKHYARKISLIHFIGARKPWTRLANRPAGLQISNASPNAFDYEHLIDRWYSVYDRYVRPTAAHEPNLAKRFAVPEHIAVWNSGDLAEQPARLDLVGLKMAASQGVSSFQAGQYTSLPLDGRIDLMMPKAKPAIPVKADPAEPAQDSHGPAVDSPAIPPPPVQAPQPQHDSGEAWNAEWQAPPEHSRPEMSKPMTEVYTAAWDAPLSSHARYFETHSEDATFPTLPANVQANDWYQSFTSSTPDPSYERPLFPWEEKPVPQARRAFPKAAAPSKNVPIAQPAQEDIVPSKPQLTLTTETTVKISEVVPQSTPAQLSFSEAMSTYTNAWDNVASIERYAKRLTKLGVATAPRMHDGLQTVPPSPRLAEHKERVSRPSTESASDGSEDGDDECEGDEAQPRTPLGAARNQSGHYKSHSGYRDKMIQTDWPRSSDAVVQATAKYSHAGSQHTPSSSTSTWGTTSKVSNTTHGPRGARTNPTPQPAVKPAVPVKTGGRVWDPKTDIETRKRDTQNVLSRFMQL